jgi:chitodextrinase
MKYEGVWDAQKVYRVGDFVTKGGSLWHCSDTNTGVMPGSNSDTWKLAVKHGKDVRERR